MRLLDKLGEGSFGAVYRAAWQGTPVAAKVPSRAETMESASSTRAEERPVQS